MTKKLTRREMLKLSGTLAAGSLLAACAPKTVEVIREVEVTKEVVVKETVVVEATQPPEPAAAPLLSGPIEGNVVIMHLRHELTEEEEAQFEGDNPGVTIEFIEENETRFFAMYAAGAPPDLMRTQAPRIPQWLARGILYDLTPYFEVSEALTFDDLMPACNYYRANSALDIGSGPIYGMPKDWSPDHTIFVNELAFEDAGLEVPDETTVLTYQEIFELAKELTKFEGDRTLMWGYGYGDWWSDGIWGNMLAELGKDLYMNSFTRLNTDEDLKAIAKYYFDMAAENVVANPLNPSPGWNGGDFAQGHLAMLQYGYWYVGWMKGQDSEAVDGHVKLLPGPTWAGVRRDPTITATGMIMSKATEIPDAAWKVFEWYNGKEPAIARAEGGWGVPALKSLFDLLPSDTEYDTQALRIVQAELELDTPPVKFNPFIAGYPIADAWFTYLQPALEGEFTFDEMYANIEADVNELIEEGIDRVGG